MRKHFIIAGLILAFEAYVGVGMFGGGVSIVCLVLFVVFAASDKQRRPQHFSVAAIYALLLVGTLTLISWNARLAQRRGTPVIAAVNRYHSEHGQYPESLEKLVPAYLPCVPHAGFTMISRDFHFNNSRPQLYFPAMFHGLFLYDFPTQSWRTSD